MTQYTMTINWEDGWLRLYSPSRVGKEQFAALRKEGFTVRRGETTFKAPWTPHREKLLREMFGVTELEDDDTDFREEARRRAEKYEGYSGSAAKRAVTFRKVADSAVAGIPLGQPILVGHHSERRHRNALERSHRNMGKSIQEADKSNYWARRAESALRRADGRYTAPATKRRIEELEADRRRWLRELDQVVAGEKKDGAEKWAGMRQHWERWVWYTDHRLAFERALLATLPVEEAVTIKPEVGGAYQRGESWAVITKVNPKTFEYASHQLTLKCPHIALTPQNYMTKAAWDQCVKELTHGGTFIVTAREGGAPLPPAPSPEAVKVEVGGAYQHAYNCWVIVEKVGAKTFQYTWFKKTYRPAIAKVSARQYLSPDEVAAALATPESPYRLFGVSPAAAPEVLPEREDAPLPEAAEITDSQCETPSPQIPDGLTPRQWDRFVQTIHSSLAHGKRAVIGGVTQLTSGRMVVDYAMRYSDGVVENFAFTLTEEGELLSGARQSLTSLKAFDPIVRIVVSQEVTDLLYREARDHAVNPSLPYVPGDVLCYPITQFGRQFVMEYQFERQGKRTCWSCRMQTPDDSREWQDCTKDMSKALDAGMPPVVPFHLIPKDAPRAGQPDAPQLGKPRAAMLWGKDTDYGTAPLRLNTQTYDADPVTPDADHLPLE